MTTREEVLDEIREVEKDLLAFKRARSCIYERVQELETNPARRELLTDWPAFNVIDNGLILAIVRCEGLLDDYRKFLDQEELPDNVVKLEKKQ